MQVITTLTNYPNQRHQLVISDGTSANFHLYYSVRQRSWYFDIEYQDTIINGNKVVLTPNALRQFKNIFPFGLMFYTDGYVEPFRLEDFSSGRVKMAILDSEEVEQIEKDVYNR